MHYPLFYTYIFQSVAPATLWVTDPWHDSLRSSMRCRGLTHVPVSAFLITGNMFCQTIHACDIADRAVRHLS